MGSAATKLSKFTSAKGTPLESIASKTLSAKTHGRTIASKTLGKGGSFTVIKGKSGKWGVRNSGTGNFVGSALSQAPSSKRPKKLKLDFSAEDAEFHNKLAEAAAKDFLE